MTHERSLRLPVLAALAVLLAHGLVATFFELPGTFNKYTLAAEQHLAGELPAERLVDLSPLYFELAVAATRIMPAAGVLLEGLQILLVAASAGLFAWLLGRRFGRRLTLVALLAFALDRHVLVYERILEPEALFLFTILLFLAGLERSATADGDTAPIVAGVGGALSLGLRPTFLPVFVLVPLYLRLRRGPSPWRRGLVFALPVVAALGLLALRTTAVTGDLDTPVMNPGTVFYEGNQPLSRGTSAVYPPIVLALVGIDDDRPDAAHEHYRRVARASTGEELSIAEVNAYWSARARGHLAAAPLHAAGLLREKLLNALHGYRLHDVDVAWRYDQNLPLPSVPFALLVALGFFGLVFEVRRFTEALPFYILGAMPLLVMLVFYVSARQRMILVPAVLYFAAAALEGLGRLWREDERRRAMLLVLLAGVVTVLLILPDDTLRDDHHFRHGQSLAHVEAAALRQAASRAPMAALTEQAVATVGHAPWVEWVPAYFPQVETSFAERLAEHLLEVDRPGVPAAFDRGVALYRAGRLDEAEIIFGDLDALDAHVYRKTRQPSWPLLYLARIEAVRGKKPAAIALLDRVLETAPGDPFALAEHVALTGNAARRAELFAVVSELDARYLLGRAHVRQGRFIDALNELEIVVERLPELRIARIYLAAALGGAGRIGAGAAHYLEAIRQAPDPLYLSQPIVDLFRRWASRRPADVRRNLIAARILHEHGHYREALVLLESLEPAARLEPAVAEELRHVRTSLAGLEGR